MVKYNYSRKRRNSSNYYTKNMKLANEWKDYKIIDMADGQKLEKWGDVILSRPDPQIIWKDKSFPKKWKEINATYHRSSSGGGSWKFNKKMPKQWQIKYKNLTFNIKPMGFKHTGLFPEQAVNWDWMINKIKSEKREIKVLNLFAYTGGATVACASAGASVCHVDSSRLRISKKNRILRKREWLYINHFLIFPRSKLLPRRCPAPSCSPTERGAGV